MKSKLFLALAFVAAAAFWGLAQAADDVVNTKHNLATGSGNSVRATAGTGADETCAFCHTPHRGLSSIPLWNRGNSAATAGQWQMYTSTTIQMVIDATPGGISMACLSCHDGVTALDNLINAPGSGNYTAGGASAGWTFTGTNGTPANTMDEARLATLGTDLTDDHPISITYNTALDTAFVSSLSITGVKLFSGKVECGSCHNPHEATLATFYRTSNANSAMCVACHKK